MEKPLALIIDDNQDICMFFSTVLEMQGFCFVVANTAKAGLYRLAISQPDLVLLDMRLRSEIGGDDILLQIRSNPRLEKAYVIVTTAYPDLIGPVKHLADLVLFKPVAVDQIRDLASKMAGLHAAETPHYFRDPATDLYNRQFYLARLEQAVERAKRRSDFLFATLYFTFETAGPHEPKLTPYERQESMRPVAERIRNSFRPTDTLARWNGEHFATLHEDLKHPDNVNVLVRRLEDEMAEPCEIVGRPRRLAPCFQSILHSRQLQDYDQILETARHSWFGLDAPASR